MSVRLPVSVGFLPTAIIALLFHSADLYAEPDGIDPGKILAIQGDVVLTQDEIDAEFSKISPEYRLNYIRDGERVNQLVAGLLRAKIVAADAKKANYDKDPIVSARLTLVADKELAETWVRKLMEDAPEADYELLANEEYLAYPDEFMTEEMVDVSHILINNEKRNNEEAFQLAQSLRARLTEDPALFDEFVTEYSEDPSKFANAGQFPRVTRGQMVQAFEEMAFAMENPGDISQPVETAYGYHIIRLNEKFPPRVLPFSEVKEEAMTKAKARHVDAYRSRYIKGLLSDPIEIPEGAVENMLKRYFGEELQLAPDYIE